MKKLSGKSGRRHLDDDEAADWDYTASTIKPLKRAKARVHAALESGAGDVEAAPRPRLKPDLKTAAGPPAHAPAQKPPALSPSAASKKTAPPIADFDRKKAKKIRSGQVEIDARIDLHGMRQAEAHAALRAFLHRCQNRDARWVLIITGKGKITRPDEDAPFDMTVDRDRGVLKRNVPRWLVEPDLRGLVVSYTTAAIAHGGDGALYVHLRKKRGEL